MPKSVPHHAGPPLRAKEELPDEDTGPGSFGCKIEDPLDNIAQDIVCPQCGSARSEPTAVDTMSGSTSRAWAAGEATCHWCSMLASVLGKGAGDISKSRSTWVSYSNALLTLALEGADDIDLDILEARRHCLFAVLGASEACTPKPATGGSAGKTSTRSASSRCSTSSCSNLGVATGASTLGVGAGPSSTAGKHVPPRLVPSGHRPVVAQSTPTKERPTISPALSPSSRSSGFEHGQVGPLGVAAAGGQHLPHTAVTDASLTMKMPPGSLGQSLARIRGTVNSYADRMTEVKWFEEFKKPTIRALCRRLEAHTEKVNASMHIELIEGFRQLHVRVNSIAVAHKALLSWRSSGDEVHLLAFREGVRPILEYLAVCQQTLAPDLKLALARAEFQALFSDSGRVCDAIEALDIAQIPVCFSAAEAAKVERVRVKVEQDIESQEEEEEAANAGSGECKGRGKSQRLGKRRRATTDGAAVKEVLQLEPSSSSSEFLTGIVDKAVQVKLYGIPSKDLDQKSYVLELFEDFTAVLVALEGFVEEHYGLAKVRLVCVLSAFATIFKVKMADAQAPQPSDLRAARHQLEQAAGSPNALLCSLAIRHYTGLKAIMDTARDSSAGGMQDEAADALFCAASDHLESLLAKAFDDLEDWITTSSDGRPMSFESFDVYLKAVAEVCIDVLTAMSQWSPSRAENQAGSVAEVVVWATTIVEGARFLAVRHFSRTLAALTEFVCPATADASASAEAGVALAAPVVADALVLQSESTGSAMGTAVFAKKNPEGKATMSLSDAIAAWGTAGLKLTRFLRDCLDKFERIASVANNFKGAGAMAFASSVGFDVAEIGIAIEKDQHLFDVLVNYITDAVSLSTKSPPLSLATTGSASECYLSELSNFCLAHRGTHVVCPSDVALSDDFADLGKALGLPAMLGHFKRTLGDNVYETHVTPTLTALVKALGDASVDINVADEAAVKKNEGRFAEILPILIRGGDIAALADAVKPLFEQEGEITLATFPHNRMMAALTEFTNAIGVQSLRVEGVQKGSAMPSDAVFDEVPIQDALLYYQCTCLARDVATLVAFLQLRLLSPVAGGMQIPKNDIEHVLPKVAHLLGDALSRLDNCVSKPEAANMEAAGWQMRRSFTSFRIWRASVAAFRKICLDVCLQAWCGRVEAMTKKTKDSCPSWEAFITETEIKVSMAWIAVQGRQASVVKHHNDLHATLESFSVAADVMDIVPKLQINPKTAPTVEVAMHTLNAARDVCTVINGLKILTAYSNHHLGPAKAAVFLQGFPEGSRGKIPSSFWLELTCLQDDARPDNGGAEASAGQEQPKAEAVVAPEHSGTTGIATPDVPAKREIAGGARPRLKRRRPA